MHYRTRPSALGWLTDNGVLLVVITTLMWGGNAVAGKFAVGNISPMALTLARWSFAALLLVCLGWQHLKADWPEIRRTHSF